MRPNPHTQYKWAVCEALPLRGRLCARCRFSVAGRRLPDPPQSRSDANASEWTRCVLWTRPVFCGPGLLLHATKLFFVDVLIQCRLSLDWIAETVTKQWCYKCDSMVLWVPRKSNDAMSVIRWSSESLGINEVARMPLPALEVAAELVVVVTHRKTLAETLGTEFNFLLLPW